MSKPKAIAPSASVSSAPKPPRGRCQMCGTRFVKRQDYQKWCSTRCRTIAYWKRRLDKLTT